MPNQNNNKRNMMILVFVVILMFAGLMALILSPTQDNVAEIRYSEILSLFDDDIVDEFDLDLGSRKLLIYLKEGETFVSKAEQKRLEEIKKSGQDPTSTAFDYDSFLSNLFGGKEEEEEDNRQIVTYLVPNVSVFLDNIDEYVRTYNRENPDSIVDYNYLPIQEQSMFWSFLPQILMLAVIVGIYFYIIRKSGLGGVPMDKITKPVVEGKESKQKTRFSDVAGADEEKRELEEIVDFLKNPTKYNSLGARIPRGVLLVGPPGTGKTLLARAVAGEASVPFFSVSGSYFVEMYAGVGAKKVRDLFEEAKKSKPSIVFIDEIDAVGKKRGDVGGSGADSERDQTLNQLLVEMDGFGTNEGVIVMAATNRNDSLDPALLRAGRFDRQVTVNVPDVKGRQDILKIHTRNKPLAPDVSLENIAKTTVGFTGADLENIANEAALLAARANKTALTREEFDEATIKVMMGPEKRSRVVSDKSKTITAYHEAGHAVVNYYLPTQDPVHQVSIIARGSAGGYTMYIPEKDEDYTMRKQLLDNIVTSMGGRVAEEIILDDISTGAYGDIRQATKIARAMVMKYGFTDELGFIEYGPSDSFGITNTYSDEAASKIDTEIKTIMDDAYVKCKEILTTHIDKLHQVAKELLEKEKIDGEEFIEIMNTTPSWKINTEETTILNEETDVINGEISEDNKL